MTLLTGGDEGSEVASVPVPNTRVNVRTMVVEDKYTFPTNTAVLSTRRSDRVTGVTQLREGVLDAVVRSKGP